MQVSGKLNKKLIKQWKKDERAHFEGWDFSYLKKRLSENNVTWDYINLSKELVKKSSLVLDIDTGGGERLLKIHPPKNSYATEGYKPNVKIARKNLKKIGVKVVYADSAHKLPFKNEIFDLILNRHGAINAKEIYRVLKKEGIFFTQQVDSRKNLVDLIKVFKEKPKWTFNNLNYRKRELEKQGFKVIKSKEWKGQIIFKDVGAIVYFLKSIPWLVDNFSVDSHLRYLEELQRKIEKNGELTFTLANFMIFAKKNN